MVIITGQKPYGKCDIVPHLFYVATWFGHLNYVPLIPMGTRLILGQQGSQYQVVRIPFSFKSLFYAWSRAAFLLGGIIAWIITLVAMNDRQMARDPGVALPLLWASGFTLAFLFVMIYPRKRLPSYQRACELAQLAGFNERGWAALNAYYGRDIGDRPGQESNTFGR